MNKVIYGHFALKDFTDSEGVFHKKDSCCYIGSGSIARSKQMTKAGGNRKDVHENSKENLYVKIIEDVESNVIEREQYWYDFFLSEGNKLFNSNRPIKRRVYSYEYFKSHFYIDESSPSGLSWINPKFFGRNSNKGNQAGTIKLKPKLHDDCHDYKSWVVCIDRKFYPVHCIVWTLANKSNLPEDKVVLHLDNDATNNKVENLKLGTQLENRKSKRKQLRNKTGVEGVRIYLKTHHYRAQINDFEGKPIRKDFHFNSKDRKYKPKSKTKIYGSREDAFVAACKWRLEMCTLYGYDETWYNLDLKDLSL